MSSAPQLQRGRPSLYERHHKKRKVSALSSKPPGQACVLFKLLYCFKRLHEIRQQRHTVLPQDIAPDQSPIAPWPASPNHTDDSGLSAPGLHPPGSKRESVRLQHTGVGRPLYANTRRRCIPQSQTKTAKDHLQGKLSRDETHTKHIQNYLQDS